MIRAGAASCELRELNDDSGYTLRRSKYSAGSWVSIVHAGF